MADSEFNEDRLLRSALGPSAGCLPLETLAALAESQLDADALAKAKAHLQACAHCRNEAILLMEFQVSAPRPEEAESVAWIESRLRASTPSTSPTPKRQGWSLAEWFRQTFTMRRWQALSLAAACLLFLVAGGIFLRQGGEPLTPSKVGEPVWRSLQFHAVAPAGEIDGAPSELQWDAVPGAARYVARVLTVDRSEIWKGDSTLTILELPATLRPQMTAGRTFLWNVTAQDAAGRTLAESPLQSFHISTTPR